MAETWDESRDEKSTFVFLRDNDERERSRVPERLYKLCVSLVRDECWAEAMGGN